MAEGLNNPSEVALVTGAGSGIGRATALRLSRRGASLVLLDIDREAMSSLAAEIGSDRALAVAADVSSVDDMASAVEDAVARFGRLDTVVANAGIEAPGTVTDISLELWERTISINLTGVFLTARFTLPHLYSSQDASLVVVASDAGLAGAQGWPAYAATKHAAVGLMKSMALDHGPAGVRINAVCPGWVSTPLLDRVMGEGGKRKVEDCVPLGRIASPDDVAAAVAHLTSTDSAHTHGSVYVMDGGQGAGGFRPPVVRS